MFILSVKCKDVDGIIHLMFISLTFRLSSNQQSPIIG